MRDIDSDLLKEFLWSAKEDLQVCEDILLRLEQGQAESAEEDIKVLYRLCHSLKGSAGLVQLAALERAAHASEELLERFRDHPHRLEARHLAALLIFIDATKQVLEVVEASGKESGEWFDDFHDALARCAAAEDDRNQPGTTELAAALELADNIMADLPAGENNSRPAMETCGYLAQENPPLADSDIEEHPLETKPKHKKDGSTHIRPRATPEPAPEAEAEAVPKPVETGKGTESPPPPTAPAVESPAAPASAQSSVPASVSTPPPTATPPATSAPRPDSRPTAGKSAREATADTAVRVPIPLLDRLMNLVGELVLTRNRLLQQAGEIHDPALLATSQTLDQVTSELQDHIMRTRMQPVSSVFGKFPRIVRDLSRQLGKEVTLELSGEGTELDRTILESMRDPFTHILRNCLDHGLEDAQTRAAAGKPRTGTISINAYHEGGQVIVAVRDDGRGIDTQRVRDKAVAAGLLSKDQAAQLSENEAALLICHPGLSTAEEVTSISGRGVGMDVVRSNIEAIGGHLDIHTERGQGSCIRITIPLTLAIIPALMVTCDDRLFGIPQVNLIELVGVQPHDELVRIERVRGQEVLRLREQLLTIVRLRTVLGLPERPDPDNGMLFVAIVAAGDQRFGLVVDDILDTEEIVVKPLSRHLRSLAYYAGATIRGDGRICLILDMPGIMRAGRITTIDRAAQQDDTEFVDTDRFQEFLVFDLGNDEQFALPLLLVNRVEQHPARNLSRINNCNVILHGQELKPVIRLDEHGNAQPMQLDLASDDVVHLVQLTQANVGLLIKNVIDSVTVDLGATLDQTSILREETVSALAVVHDRPTALIDIYKLMDRAFPNSQTLNENAGLVVQRVTRPRTPHQGGPTARILYCEDAQFFQNVVANYLRDAGHQVDVLPDGQAGWDHLQAHPESYNLILTDLEMPHMNGWELMRAIRSLPAFDHLPLIALSSLHDEEARQCSLRAGATTHVVKLQKDQLLAVIDEVLSNAVQTQEG